MTDTPPCSFRSEISRWKPAATRSMVPSPHFDGCVSMSLCLVLHDLPPGGSEVLEAAIWEVSEKSLVPQRGCFACFDGSLRRLSGKPSEAGSPTQWDRGVDPGAAFGLRSCGGRAFSERDRLAQGTGGGRNNRTGTELIHKAHGWLVAHGRVARRSPSKVKNPSASSVSATVAFAGRSDRRHRSTCVRPRPGPSPHSTRTSAGLAVKSRGAAT